MQTTSGRRVHLVLAWLVLVAVCVVAAAIGQMTEPVSGDVKEEIAAIGMLKAAVATRNETVLESLHRDAAGKPAIGLHEVVATAEFHGPQAAFALLVKVRSEIAQDASDGLRVAHAAAILENLYDGPADALAARADALSAEDRAYLRETMLWTGRLAAAPEGAADRDDVVRSAWHVIFGGAGAGSYCCLSFLAGMGFLVGSLAGWFRTSWAFTPATVSRPVLVESAALAIGVLLLLHSVHEALVAILPHYTAGSVVFSVFALGVVPLLWARMRGIPWDELRRLVGLKRGRGVLREMGAGVLGFLALLPVAILAGLATKVIEGVTGVEARPHPEALQAGSLDTVSFLWLLVEASVVAPLVEETLFRGLVFQSLRTSTRDWHRVWSFLFSAAVQAILFALLHPQGIGGVPAIATIGALLSLVREWRGSLIAPMTTHALWNGAIFLLVAAFLR